MNELSASEFVRKRLLNFSSARGIQQNRYGDGAPRDNPSDGFPVIGIGASAGIIELNTVYRQLKD